ncbi:hypothetical protein DRO66_07140 [Candidatus Bathyarchaeota archaeon]|nr:MAG: hypothetical protein DRO66_07140 [Candidatus Bathyarchaeota archaeon]
MSLSKQFIQNRLAYLKKYFVDFNNLKLLKGAKLKPLKLKIAGVLHANQYDTKGFRGAEMASKYTKRYANVMVTLEVFSPMEYIMSAMEIGILLTGNMSILVDALKVTLPMDAVLTNLGGRTGRIPEGYRHPVWEQFQRTFVLYRRSTASDGAVGAEVDDPKMLQAIRKFLMADHLKVFKIPFTMGK